MAQKQETIYERLYKPRWYDVVVSAVVGAVVFVWVGITMATAPGVHYDFEAGEPITGLRFTFLIIAVWAFAVLVGAGYTLASVYLLPRLRAWLREVKEVLGYCWQRLRWHI